jgi:AGCS family alanine or glycine:cation symporter
MVLLSSGVWNEKLPNQFQKTDIEVLANRYDEGDAADAALLKNHLNNTASLPLFSGVLHVLNGKVDEDYSILHARSLAENMEILAGKQPYTGEITVIRGKVTNTSNDVIFTGFSLIHSAPLTTAAYTRSFLGDFGKYIVAIGLLLFAFSTAIAWSYYGDRAVTYLIGSRYVQFYRIIFVVSFFLASFTDTTIIWNLSLLTVAFMAIPNLIGLLVLHKEVKTTIRDYWKGFRDEYSS